MFEVSLGLCWLKSYGHLTFVNRIETHPFGQCWKGWKTYLTYYKYHFEHIMLLSMLSELPSEFNFKK